MSVVLLKRWHARRQAPATKAQCAGRKSAYSNRTTAVLSWQNTGKKTCARDEEPRPPFPAARHASATRAERVRPRSSSSSALVLLGAVYQSAERRTRRAAIMLRAGGTSTAMVSNGRRRVHTTFPDESELVRSS